jgi:hypothetical protein
MSLLRVRNVVSAVVLAICVSVSGLTGTTTASAATTFASAPAAASPGPGQMTVFVRGNDKKIYMAKSTNSGATWTEPLTIFNLTHPSGQSLVGPTVVSPSPGRLDVFIVGLNKTIWQNTSTNSGANWQGWTDLGSGATPSQPAAASSGPGRISLFMRGNGNAIWTKDFVEGVGWNHWASIGGETTSGPTAAFGRVLVNGTLSNVISVMVRGTDNKLYQRLKINGTWAANWTLFGVGAATNLTSVSPSVAFNGNNEFNRFFRKEDGSIGQVFANSGVQNRAGSSVSAPTSVSVAPGQTDLFVIGTSRALFVEQYANGQWGQWRSIGGYIGTDGI